MALLISIIRGYATPIFCSVTERNVSFLKRLLHHSWSLVLSVVVMENSERSLKSITKNTCSVSVHPELIILSKKLSG